MKRLMPAIKTVFIILSLAAVTGSCRKELCNNHDAHSLKVRAVTKAEWEREWERNVSKNWEERWRGVLGFSYDDLRPEPATGIRAQVFTDGILDNESNLETDGGRLHMRPGTHDILFYNNDTEYIVFENEGLLATAVAGTRTRTRSTYNTRFSEETTVNAPDQLFGCFIAEHQAEESLTETEISAFMRPLTYNYIIHFMFKSGLNYVALARGALSGMAGSVYLQTGRTTEDIATILFDDCIVDQKLGIHTQVLSFGVPDADPIPEQARDNHRFNLNLEVRLNNGKILTFDYDVTDQVKVQPRGGVIVIQDIVIDDEDGMEGSGGFDVNVDGWGEFEDIELPLN